MNTPFFRQCLRTIIEPVARYCIRRSIGLMDIFEDLKVVLLRVAQEELRPSGEEFNVSKLSAMTGVHRRDVRRICKHDEARTDTQNPISKLIGRWQTAARFRRKDGKPRVLQISGEKNEFAELVELVCHDLHPGTVLAELERLGVVERVPTGLKLLRGIYVNRGDSRQAYEFMASDMRDLLSAVEENLSSSAEAPNLHLSTIFDRIDPQRFPEIREWLLKEGSLQHQRVREYLSQFDSDSNPALSKKRKSGRVVFSSFSLTEGKEPSQDEKK